STFSPSHSQVEEHRMKQLTRHSFLKPRVAMPAGMGVGSIPEATEGHVASRRAVLQGPAGAGRGGGGGPGAAPQARNQPRPPRVASIALDTQGSALAAEPKAVVTKPSGPIPAEPVTAYVRNAERHEVTVMSGRIETTYRDPVLVKRLLDAAR